MNWGVSVKQIWSQIGRLSAVMGLGLLVASCTAIRPEHCPYTDWRATGELHASKGYKSRLPGLFETCMAIGVLPMAMPTLPGTSAAFWAFAPSKTAGRRASTTQ